MRLSFVPTFSQSAKTLAAMLPLDIESAYGAIVQVRKQAQIVRVAKSLHWERKPALMGIRDVDRFCREALDQVCVEIPIWGDDLIPQYEEEEEIRLAPEMLGGNSFSYDDMYELGMNPGYASTDMSLMTFLLLLGFDIDDEEIWINCAAHFHWPIHQKPELDWGVGIDEKGLNYLQKHLTPEMYAALRITIIPPPNWFLQGNPEDPFDLEFTAPNIKDLKKDLVEAERLLALAENARKAVENDPGLLPGLVDVLRECLKVKVAKARKK